MKHRWPRKIQRTAQLSALLCLGMVVASTSCSSDETDDNTYTTSSSSGVGGSGGGPPPSSGLNSSSATGGPSPCDDTADTALDSEEMAFLDLINNYRLQNNLSTLTGCISMHRSAQLHSENMRDLDFFEHEGLDGKQAWDRACTTCFERGCGPTTAMAENIAAGNSGAAGTFDQWRNSPGHNANMLGSSFTMIGIGRATGGGQYGSYWTNVFGGDDEPSCY